MLDPIPVVIDPFKHETKITSYSYNIRDKYPAIYVYSSNIIKGTFSILDGYLTINKEGPDDVETERTPLLGNNIEDIVGIINRADIGYTCQILSEDVNTDSIFLREMNTRSSLSTTIDTVPLDINMIKHPGMLDMCYLSYSGSVDISINEKDNSHIDDLRIVNESGIHSAYLDKKYVGYSLNTVHTLKRFIMYISDTTVVNNYEDFMNDSNVYQSVVTGNTYIKGIDNDFKKK